MTLKEVELFLDGNQDASVVVWEVEVIPNKLQLSRSMVKVQEDFRLVVTSEVAFKVEEEEVVSGEASEVIEVAAVVSAEEEVLVTKIVVALAADLRLEHLVALEVVVEDLVVVISKIDQMAMEVTETEVIVAIEATEVTETIEVIVQTEEEIVEEIVGEIEVGIVTEEQLEATEILSEVLVAETVTMTETGIPDPETTTTARERDIMMVINTTKDRNDDIEVCISILLLVEFRICITLAFFTTWMKWWVCCFHPLISIDNPSLSC